MLGRHLAPDPNGSGRTQGPSLPNPSRPVLLVTPPYHCGVAETAGVWMPLALGYLAGALREAGREVAIYDAMSLGHDHAAIGRAIAERRPGVVGVGAITGAFPDAIEVLATAKAVDPSIVTVIGGVHPTMMWRETLEKHGDVVDYVIRHEGEESLPELLDALDAGRDPATVSGIAMNTEAGPTCTRPRPFITDLDALPVAWDLFDWSLYTYRPEPGSILAMVSTSRGCSHACTFCSQQRLWKRTWRARSPEAIVAELEHLSTTYGMNVAMITDEMPTVDPHRWRRLLDLLIERDLDVQLYLETRVDDILRDRALLGRYREAGIVHVYVGAESTWQDELDTFKKGLKVEETALAIKLLNEVDIVTETSFVLGMPNETPERIRKTVQLALEFDPDLAFFLAIAPWPYADIYHELEPHIEDFDYGNYNLAEPVVKPLAMTRQELREETDRAHQVFFTEKAKRLGSMTPYKRDFMLSAMRILAEHAYFGPRMRDMFERLDDDAIRGVLDGGSATGCPVLHEDS